ncbi:MerR family transcriptional regulator [Escherichia coli]|nr:MerR family transcriptional regulator [Escherichia coli]
MAYYSIGDVAERCGINPVTLRAWQRRYGLLKPQRSEGGHRLFDEEDIQRIEEIKRWISNGVPVGKVKALLETTSQDTEDDWSRLQEEMMSILRMANPAKLRARIISLGREYPVDQLINHVYLPVRQRLVLDHNTSRIMSSMFDGALIEYAATSLFEMRRKPGKEAILMAWNVEERARLWLEAWRLSLSGWHISVLAGPIESPRPELFPTQTLIVWTGMAPTRRQNELLQHWGEQGYKVIFHAP